MPTEEYMKVEHVVCSKCENQLSFTCQNRVLRVLPCLNCSIDEDIKIGNLRKELGTLEGILRELSYD